MNPDPAILSRELRLNRPTAVADLRARLTAQDGDVRAVATDIGWNESTLHRLLRLPHLQHLKPLSRARPTGLMLPCPSCAAPISKPCRSLKTGKPVLYPHARRQ